MSSRPRLLVVMASYGTAHGDYLQRLIDEYRSMQFDVDIVITSNIQKQVPAGVEVVVGMPTDDPWSLPFAHKQILADRVDSYDLFIYCEDDTLATQQNIEAFLRVSKELQENEIPGFLRYEKLPDGSLSYCDATGHFHWEPGSVVRRGQSTFAFFTNEHAAFYLLTQKQLRRAIESGGFLVPPHRGKYDLACTAATDPYTQCGFRKLVCVSHLEDFIIHHLPNKYVGTKFGILKSEFDLQVAALLNVYEKGLWAGSLFRTETRLPDASYSKDYYEPSRSETLNMIPESARSVLSIGCGAGASEKFLARKGIRVTAVCLDSVIRACVEGDGIELLSCDFSSLKEALGTRHFDCIFLSNVLHLVPDPEATLSLCASFLSENGTAIALVPNLSRLPDWWRKISGHPFFQTEITFEKAGVHPTSRATLKKWFMNAGLSVKRINSFVPPSGERISHLTFGIADRHIANELLVTAEPA